MRSLSTKRLVRPLSQRLPRHPRESTASFPFYVVPAAPRLPHSQRGSPAGHFPHAHAVPTAPIAPCTPTPSTHLSGHTLVFLRTSLVTKLPALLTPRLIPLATSLQPHLARRQGAVQRAHLRGVRLVQPHRLLPSTPLDWVPILVILHHLPRSPHPSTLRGPPTHITFCPITILSLAAVSLL